MRSSFSDGENAVNVDALSTKHEGWAALTSAQKKELWSYVARPKVSFDYRWFDASLVQCWNEIFRMNSTVTTALSDSIQDEHCTKRFADWDVTVSQFEGFAAAEPENGLHYQNVRAACAVVSSLFNVGTCNPQTVTDGKSLVELWSNPKAMAGAIKIGSTKEASIDTCLNGVHVIKRLIERGTAFANIQIPALTYHRSQLNKAISDGQSYCPEKLSKKDRMIWGIDAATNSLEAQYSNVLTEAVAKKVDVYAGGKDPSTLRDLIRRARSQKFYWTSLDFSKFDQSVPSWLISWCFSVLKKSFSQQYWPELDFIEYNFINTEIALPGVGFKKKRKGIPSGSGFTQLVGSMANAVMILSYVASNCVSCKFEDKLRYVRDEIQDPSGNSCMFVMGDDNLIFTDRKLDLEDLSGYVKRVFGVTVNAVKSESGTRTSCPTFLSREWRSRGEWQDPIYLVINTSHPERYRTYDGYSPWHIIYGLFCTYQESFPTWMSERWIVTRMMSANGGVAAIANIPHHELPGVFKAYGSKALDRIRRRAELVVAQAA